MTILDIKPGDYFVFEGKVFMKGKPDKQTLGVRIVDPHNGEIITLPKNMNVNPVFRRKKENEYVNKTELLKFLYEKMSGMTYDELDGASAIAYFVSSYPTTDVCEMDVVDEKLDNVNDVLIQELHKENIKPESYNRIFLALKSFFDKEK